MAILSVVFVAGRAQPCAADDYTNVVVPGGRTALARALGLDSVPERPRFIAELVRVLHEAPAGRNRTIDARLKILSEHFVFVSEVRKALGEAGGTLSLANAKDADTRRHVTPFLDLIGLQLREREGRWLVERRLELAAPLVQALAAWGAEPVHVQDELNGGRAIAIDIADDTVPLPLTLDVWRRIADTALTPANAFLALLSNRQTSLFCYGLSAADLETRAFFQAHADLAQRLARDAAGVFAASGAALHVSGNTVVPAGGAAASALWESALGVPVADAERFITELFTRLDGRIAHIYDVVDQLDPAHRAFALGTWLPDQDKRTVRFAALLATTEKYRPWSVRDLPFAKPPVDAGLVLSRMRVLDDGSPAQPVQTGLWQSAFDSLDIPSEGPGFVLPDTEPLDAAWVMDRILSPGPASPEQRLSQITFGQRAFASSARADLAAILIPLRAVARFPALVFTLERIGITDPQTYTAIARHAARLSDLGADRAVLALQLFQGTIAAVDRMVRVRSLSTTDAQQILTGLAALPLSSRGYDGAFSTWLMSVLPPLDEGASRDDQIVGLVSGRTDAGTAPTIEWEGQTYRVDVATAERRRIDDVWSRLHGKTFGAAIRLAEIATAVREANLDSPALIRARQDVDAIAADLGRMSLPPSSPLVPSVRRAQQALAGVRNERDARRTARAAEPLAEAADLLLGDALTALAYAAALEGPMANWLSGRESRDHDFGFSADEPDMRGTVRWQTARVQIQPGAPWHLRGSLLALETELASALFRGSLAQAVSGAQWDAQEFLRQGIAVTIARLNPLDLDDASADRIVSAVQRGRDRVRALSGPAGADRLTDGSGIDGWRRGAIRWALQNDPSNVTSYLTLSELVMLGDSQAGNAAFGAATGPESGCLCLAWPPPGRSWRLVTARPQRMLLGSEVLDLTIHVILTLRELHVPARLARSVLALALPEYIGAALPLHTDDWWSLERAGQKITRSQIEDYVAALATKGPLIPAQAR